MANSRSELRWRKASASGANGCVEVARSTDGTVALRDSKLGEASPVLVFRPDEWAAWVDGCQNGEFDDLA